ncbi:MAG: hypothetical protein IJS01_13780 [Lentisphaeria bacterium]|nr:hypothetical protein [Lentisphaeria bacterium]
MWRKLSSAAGLVCAFSLWAGGESYFRDGERWMLTGDSITSNDTYRRAVKRIVDHFHPGNKIEFINRAVWGVDAAFKTKVEGRPTMVSVMLGMNNIIHCEYPHTPDFSKKAEEYRKRIEKHVDFYKSIGADVVLFTPTLTDERVSSFFSPMYTRKGLEKLGEVIRGIGKEKNCLVIPVAEELEAYDDSLGPNQLARIDGVHPYGEAQYRIAWSILHHLNAAGKLTGKRALSPVPPPVPVEVARNSFYLNGPGDKIVLKFRGKEDVRFRLTWSLAGERGTEEIALGKDQTVSWTLPASDRAFELAVGDQKQAVVDLQTADGKLSFYLIDLARTRVVKPVDGELNFTIKAPEKPQKGERSFHSKYASFAGTRPEGDLIGTVNIREDGPNLWLSGRVYDSMIDHDAYWIYGRDCLRILLDFRPGGRFGNLTIDRDVNVVMISPRTVPHFAMIALAWNGSRYQHCMYSDGERTPDGYKWFYGYAGHITNYTAFDIRKLDVYGFNLSVIDRDGKKSFHLNSVMPTVFDDTAERALNQLIIVDRKNKFPGNETTTVQCFGF